MQGLFADEEEKMRYVLYGVPKCEVCKAIFTMLTNAKNAGVLSGEAEMKLVEADVGSDFIAIHSNLTELVCLDEYYEPPALVAYDGDKMVFGRGAIKKVTDVKVSELRKLENKEGTA